METTSLGILLKYLIWKRRREFPNRTSDEHMDIKKQIDEVTYLIMETHRQWLRKPDNNTKDQAKDEAMIHFKDYTEQSQVQKILVEIEDNFDGETLNILHEGGNSKLWVMSASLFLFSRINSISKKIKLENNVNKTVDLLGEQNRNLANFINLGIASGLGDKSVYKKGKK